MPSGESLAAVGDQRCRYCLSLDLAKYPQLAGDPSRWTEADLARGRRSENGGTRYHCYAAYCD